VNRQGATPPGTCKGLLAQHRNFAQRRPLSGVVGDLALGRLCDGAPIPEVNGSELNLRADSLDLRRTRNRAASQQAAESRSPGRLRKRGAARAKYDAGRGDLCQVPGGPCGLVDHEPSKRRAQYAIAYTPLHASARGGPSRALKNAGFENVHTVASQRVALRRFSHGALSQSRRAGRPWDAVMRWPEGRRRARLRQHPECRSVRVAVRDSKGSYQMLTGDQSASCWRRPHRCSAQTGCRATQSFRRACWARCPLLGSLTLARH